MPRSAISSARFSAAFVCGPDTRTGPRRSRSSSETRSPGGTVSSESSTGFRVSVYELFGEADR